MGVKLGEKSIKGLPAGYMGRIGMAISPADPNVVYAIVEARYGKNGFYKSTNKEKIGVNKVAILRVEIIIRKIFCDPKNVDKVFSMNTYLHHTEDGGKNFKRTGEKGSM